MCKPVPHSALAGILNILLTGEDPPAQGALPELTLMHGALDLLSSESMFTIYDPEESAAPGVVVPSDEQVQQMLEQDIGALCAWSGDFPGSGGYGDISAVNTPKGRGLCISVGGSVVSSAQSFWIVPVA